MRQTTETYFQLGKRDNNQGVLDKARLEPCPLHAKCQILSDLKSENNTARLACNAALKSQALIFAWAFLNISRWGISQCDIYWQTEWYHRTYSHATARPQHTVLQEDTSKQNDILSKKHVETTQKAPWSQSTTNRGPDILTSAFFLGTNAISSVP